MRVRVGATLWIATILLFVAEIVTASAWPEPYAVLDRTISDLGRIACDEFCSPWHPVFNVAIVGSGILTSLGALLMVRVWARRRLGRAAMLSMAAGGVFVSLVGLFPTDANPAAHSVVAVLQWVLQLTGMVLVFFAARGMSRVIRVVTALAVVISLLGFIAFTTLASPHGLLERFAFDTLTWWQVVIGVLIVTTGRARPLSH